MEYQNDVDAWRAESPDDCLCPDCSMPVDIGYHLCYYCVRPVNVCKISDGDDVFYLITKENDDLGFVNEKEHTSFEIPDNIVVPLD